jgi:omega-6 fatty acid desaturase (delta-12 desaturase)
LDLDRPRVLGVFPLEALFLPSVPKSIRSFRLGSHDSLFNPSPHSCPRRQKAGRLWVHATNLAIGVLAVALTSIFGITGYLVIQLTALLVASTAGVWLFYVQHQFEDVYWERKPEWDFADAALQGSSFYKLPRILQWFSGNIGFHHIHHLSPRIPNYRLERAHQAEPLFQSVKPLTLRRSLKSFTFRLWDEGRKRLVGYKATKSSENRH